MGDLSSYRRPIKSIQSFTITISDPNDTATATINAVVVVNTFLIKNGQILTGTTFLEEQFANIEITDTTTITATRDAHGNGATPIIKGFAVEYY